MHEMSEVNTPNSAQPVEKHNLMKLIRKLRWIGMDDDAKRVALLTASLRGPTIGALDKD